MRTLGAFLLEARRKDKIMEERNVALKAAIFASGEPAYLIARKAKLSRTYLSSACTGRANLRPEEKERLARVLGKEVNELFPADRA